METDYEKCLAAAERAAEWLILLPEATFEERREFMEWLRQSPLHVREFLLAARCKELLEQHAPFADTDDNPYLNQRDEIPSPRKPGQDGNGKHDT